MDHLCGPGPWTPYFSDQKKGKNNTNETLLSATGLDKIPAKLLKDASSVIAKPITYLINLTISSGVIPSQWKEAKVTPIFKAGKKDD